MCSSEIALLDNEGKLVYETEMIPEPEIVQDIVEEIVIEYPLNILAELS